MKFLLIFSFLLASTHLLKSQDLPGLIKEADKLEAIPDEKAAFNKFKVILKLDPTNLYTLCKCSELCCRIGARQSDLKNRDSYYEAALIYAKNALKHYPHSDEANVMMALAIGRNSMVQSGKEKISSAKEIKHYAETALKINPNNFKAWHILGKWNYEISNLNVMERAAARVFYGGLPSASLQSSIHAYEKARSINSGFLLNYLELSKAYKRNSEKPKAISLLKELILLPSRTEDDPRIKKEAASLIKIWQ